MTESRWDRFTRRLREKAEAAGRSRLRREGKALPLPTRIAEDQARQFTLKFEDYNHDSGGYHQ